MRKGAEREKEGWIGLDFGRLVVLGVFHSWIGLSWTRFGSIFLAHASVCWYCPAVALPPRLCSCALSLSSVCVCCSVPHFRVASARKRIFPNVSRQLVQIQKDLVMIVPSTVPVTRISIVAIRRSSSQVGMEPKRQLLKPWPSCAARKAALTS